MKTLSLETCKLLKEAGWVKLVHFYYVLSPEFQALYAYSTRQLNWNDGETPTISAPTLDELIEDLRWTYGDITITSDRSFWIIETVNSKGKTRQHIGDKILIECVADFYLAFKNEEK